MSAVPEYPFAQHIRLGALHQLSLSLHIRSACFRGRRMRRWGETTLPVYYQRTCESAFSIPVLMFVGFFCARCYVVGAKGKAFCINLRLQHATLAMKSDYFHSILGLRGLLCPLAALFCVRSLEPVSQSRSILLSRRPTPHNCQEESPQRTQCAPPQTDCSYRHAHEQNWALCRGR
ncbi:hypothetical protein EDB85DRAFT_136165 [Lactarius pseudohatsudake]|nr:hypothetical protein EDB85DRAFT_136165 [Lactarius pseudohatsudake]